MKSTFILFVILNCFYGALAITVNDCPSVLPRDKYLLVYGDKCYYFHMYQELDFSSAKDACFESGGSLALVKSKDINGFLHTTLEYKFTKEVSNLNDDYFWIGLTDLEQEGHFKWIDGASMKYQNFATLQGPGNFDINPIRFVEDCVAMNPNTGEWYDYKCESGFFIFDEHRPYICEYKAEEHTTTTSPTTTTTPTTTTPTTTSSSRSSSTEKTTTTMPVVPIFSTGIVIIKQNSTTSKKPCVSMVCKKDCGLSGYAIDPSNGCFMCSCNVP